AKAPCACAFPDGLRLPPAPPSSERAHPKGWALLLDGAVLRHRSRGRDGRGGERDTEQCLRTVPCQRAGERLQARARPAGAIPAGSTIKDKGSPGRVGPLSLKMRFAESEPRPERTVSAGFRGACAAPRGRRARTRARLRAG